MVQLLPSRGWNRSAVRSVRRRGERPRSLGKGCSAPARRGGGRPWDGAWRGECSRGEPPSGLPTAVPPQHRAVSCPGASGGPVPPPGGGRAGGRTASRSGLRWAVGGRGGTGWGRAGRDGTGRDAPAARSGRSRCPLRAGAVPALSLRAPTGRVHPSVTPPPPASRCPFLPHPDHVQVTEEDRGGEQGQEPARGGHVRPRHLQHAGRARPL